MTGKVRHADQATAELLLARMDRTDPKRLERRAYQCPSCRGWHLTKLSLADYAALQAAAYEVAPSVPVNARAPMVLATIQPCHDNIPSPLEVARRRPPREAPKAEEARRLVSGGKWWHRIARWAGWNSQSSAPRT